MVRVKICGITNYRDAHEAVYCGAWALGFIFYKKSPRYIQPSTAREIVETLPPFVTAVGVFVDEKEEAVRKICHCVGIHAVQFHGDEDPSYCRQFKGFKVIKAFRIKDEVNWRRVRKYKVDAYLFDTYLEGARGGTGETFQWEILREANFDRPFILSGGLNPGNVREAIKILHPYAVDVASGVEKSSGVKNHRLMRAFFACV